SDGKPIRCPVRRRRSPMSSAQRSASLISHTVASPMLPRAHTRAPAQHGLGSTYWIYGKFGEREGIRTVDPDLGMDVIARRPFRRNVNPQQSEIFVAKDRDVVGRLVDRHRRSLVLCRRRQRERANEKRCCKEMPHGMILQVI